MPTCRSAPPLPGSCPACYGSVIIQLENQFSTGFHPSQRPLLPNGAIPMLLPTACPLSGKMKLIVTDPFFLDRSHSNFRPTNLTLKFQGVHHPEPLTYICCSSDGICSSIGPGIWAPQASSSLVSDTPRATSHPSTIHPHCPQTTSRDFALLDYAHLETGRHKNSPETLKTHFGDHRMTGAAKTRVGEK